jgi:epoxyqueuosine reductase
VRNAAIVAANLGRHDLRPSLGRLLAEPSPLLRGAAAWSLGQLGGDRPLLERALAAEEVAWVKGEIELALDS